MSFPGRSDRDDPWFRVGRVDVTSSVLVPALCVVSIVLWAFVPGVVEALALFPSDARGGQVWRLLTWPLANTPSIWTVLMLAMLWFFGRELERMVGRNRYLFLLVVLALVPGLVATAVGAQLSGAHIIQVAVFAIFCAELPDIRFWGAIPAWVFAVVIIGIELLQLIGLDQTEQIVVLLAALVTGALVARSFGLLTDYPWLPAIGVRRQRHERRQRVPRAGSSTVVAGPWLEPPSEGLSSFEQSELDALLDKTSASGLGSLTRDEKSRLNELSKKLRQRDR